MVLLCCAHPGRVCGQRDALEVPFVLSRLSLDIAVDYERAALGGTATLRLRNVATHPVSSIPLLLNRLMTVSAVTSAEGAALSFVQDVVVFQDDSMLQVNAIAVRLGRSIAPGDSLTIEVRYGGRLVGYSETGSLYIRDHVDRDFTIIREDAYAFPVLGVPAWSVNATIRREPFGFSAAVRVPEGLVVATGGQGQPPERHDSLVTWRYTGDQAVPFLNIAIAPYQMFDTGGVRIFHFPADSAGGRMLARAVGGAIQRFTAWYGPLHQDVRLTITEIPDGWGSQASLTGGIIETAAAFRDRSQRYQVYHELSHLWNLEERERPSPRWNEGLASFLQWRMAAELDGWNDWPGQLDRLEQSLKRHCGSGSPCGTVSFSDYGKQGVTDLSYSVGSLMFYLLYHVMGPEAFDRAYRSYREAHADGIASSADLATAFRRTNRVSERIFDDWFFTTRWYTKLAAGQSVEQMLEEYRRP